MVVTDMTDSGRSGFTLLEVVLGMVLLASLVSGSVLALSRHNLAVRHAQLRRDAAGVGESMIDRWIESRSGIPLRASGSVPDRVGWRWTTEPIAARVLLGVPVRIIQFRIVASDSGSATRRPIVLLELELVKRMHFSASPVGSP